MRGASSGQSSGTFRGSGRIYLGGNILTRSFNTACSLAVPLLVGAGVARAAAQQCPQVPPLTVPFAVELADSGRFFHGALTPDATEVWFFKRVGNNPDAEEYRLFRARRARRGWGPAEQVTLGGDASDLYPSFTPDGQRLVFASYRRARGDTTAHPSASLWVAERRGPGFAEPRAISALLKPGYYFSQPTVLPDGSLQFQRTTPDWATTTTMIAAPAGDSWAPAQPDSLVMRWKGWRPDVHLWGGERTPDGHAVLLEVADVDTVTKQRGQTDLWVSVLRDGTWREPVRLGRLVNSSTLTDNFAWFTPDGCSLAWTLGFTHMAATDWRGALREAGLE